MSILRKILLSVTALLLFTALLAADEYPAILKKPSVPRRESGEKKSGPRYKFILLSDTHMDGTQYHPDKKTILLRMSSCGRGKCNPWFMRRQRRWMRTRNLCFTPGTPLMVTR